MRGKIRQGEHDTLVISTLVPEKHHPDKETSPVIEVAIKAEMMGYRAECMKVEEEVYNPLENYSFSTVVMAF